MSMLINENEKFNTGTIVFSTIKKNTIDDNFPIVNNNDISGGYKSVKTIEDLYSIPDFNRELGMRVKVIDTDKEYELKEVLDNTGWSAISANSSGIPIDPSIKNGDLLTWDGYNIIKLDGIPESKIFKTFSISGFTNNVGTVENGSIIKSISFSFSFLNNRIPKSIKLRFNSKEKSILNTERTFTLTDEIFTSNTTFNLIVEGDDGTLVTASTGISFKSNLYYGISKKTDLLESEILTLNKKFADNKTFSNTYNCTGGNYPYLIYPSRFGDIKAKVGGLSFTDFVITPTTLTNSLGYSEGYLIYRFKNLQTGNSIVLETS